MAEEASPPKKEMREEETERQREGEGCRCADAIDAVMCVHCMYVWTDEQDRTEQEVKGERGAYIRNVYCERQGNC